MTPAAHWSPDDYYRASRAARRAWEATQPQLVLGLEQDDGTGNTTSLVVPSSCSSPPSPQPTPHVDGNPPQGRGGGLDNHNQGGQDG